MTTRLEPVPTHTPVHGQPSRCPSCHATAEGNYCAACGESTTIHPPSAGEFIHEFIGHFVALEGKLWKTLHLLMFRPGQLTADYLRGRRVPYILPLRLYLTLSLVMFALIKWYGVELPHVTLGNDTLGATYSHTITDPGAAKPTRAVLKISLSEDDAPDPSNPHIRSEHAVRDGIQDALTTVGQFNQKWMNNLKRFISEPDVKKSAVLNQGFLANLPYMLIGALPLFALYLKLIYYRSGRYYGEHLLFALHANAFAFLVVSAMIIVPGNVVWLAMCLYEGLYSYISPWDCVQLIPFIWLVAYLPAAMRRVYRGSRATTTLRWLILISVHLIVLATLIIGAELIGIVGYGGN